MRFEKVTPSILLRLKAQGYDLLTAMSSSADEHLTFRPIRINDIWEYASRHTPDTVRQRALVIQDMLDSHTTGNDSGGLILIE